MIQFTWPLLLWLLPMALVLHRILPPANRNVAALYGPVLAQRLEPIELTNSSWRPRRARQLLLLILWSLLVLAASGPHWIGEPVALPSAGRDLLLAVDLSESMLQEDMGRGARSIDRLSAVKQVLGEFVHRRIGDRIGLIVFGSQAYVQTPLTFDRDTLYQQLVEAQSGFAGPRTAIGDAIGLAVKRLRKRPAESRVLILLTDGRNNSGEVEPSQAAELAAREGIRIHTVGVGAEEMLVPGLLGRRRVNPSADLDEELLRAIAERTGGEYFRARDPGELERIYATLDRLEPVEQDPEMLRPQRSLMHWPLGLAIVMSALFGLRLCLPNARTLPYSDSIEEAR